MRNNPVLAALFTPTRRAVLSAVFLRPRKSWYLSELAAHLGTSPSSLQREVDAFVRAGILEKHVDGRRSYIKANTDSPVFPQLRDLIEKTSGIVPLLREAVTKLGGKVEWAFVYGSLARGQEGPASDVDLMLIGSVTILDMLPVLRRLEKIAGRAINPTIFTKDEFLRKLNRNDHFLLTVMRGRKIMLKGTQDELEAVDRVA